MSSPKKEKEVVKNDQDPSNEEIDWGDTPFEVPKESPIKKSWADYDSEDEAMLAISEPGPSATSFAPILDDPLFSEIEGLALEMAKGELMSADVGDPGPLTERMIQGGMSVSSIEIPSEIPVVIERAPPHETLAENVRLRSEKIKTIRVDNGDKLYGPIEDDLNLLMEMSKLEISEEKRKATSRLVHNIWGSTAQKWEGLLKRLLNPHQTEYSNRIDLLARYKITPDFVWRGRDTIVFMDATMAQYTAQLKVERYAPHMQRIADETNLTVYLFVLPLLLERESEHIMSINTAVAASQLVFESQDFDAGRISRIMARAMAFKGTKLHGLIKESRLEGRTYSEKLRSITPKLIEMLNLRSVEPVRDPILPQDIDQAVAQTQARLCRGVIARALEAPVDSFSAAFSSWMLRTNHVDVDWQLKTGVNLRHLAFRPGLIPFLPESIRHELERFYYSKTKTKNLLPYETHAAKEISGFLEATFSRSHDRLDVGPEHEKPGLYFPLFSMKSRITSIQSTSLTAEEDNILSMFMWVKDNIVFGLNEWSRFNRQEFCHNFLREASKMSTFSQRREYTKFEVIRGNNRVGINNWNTLAEYCRIDVSRRKRSSDPYEWSHYIVTKYLSQQVTKKETKKFRFTQSGTWEAGEVPSDFKFEMRAANGYSTIKGFWNGVWHRDVSMLIPIAGSASLSFSDDDLRTVIYINARKSKPAVPGLGAWADIKFDSIGKWLWGDCKESPPGTCPPLFEASKKLSASPTISGRLAEMDGEAINYTEAFNNKRMWRYLQVMSRTIEKVMFRAEDGERRDSVYCFSIDPHVICFMAPQRIITERQQVPFWFWYVKDDNVMPPWKDSFEEVIATDGISKVACTKVFSLEAHRLKSMIDADITVRTVTTTSLIEGGRPELAYDYALTTFYGAAALNQTTHASLSTMRYFYTGLMAEGVNLIQLIKEKIHHLPKNYVVSWVYNHMPRLLEKKSKMLLRDDDKAGNTVVPSLITMTEITSLFDKVFFSYPSAAGNRAMHQPDVVLAEEIDGQMKIAKEINEGYEGGDVPNVVSGGPQTPITKLTWEQHVQQARLVMHSTSKSCRWSLFQEMTAFHWRSKHGFRVPNQVNVQDLLNMTLWELDRVTASIPNPHREKNSRERATVTEAIIYCEKVLGLYTVGDCLVYASKNVGVLFADGKDKIQDGDKRLFLIMTLFLLQVAKMTEDAYRVISEKTPFELVSRPNESRYEIFRNKIDKCKTISDTKGVMFDVMTMMIDLTKFGPTNNLLDYLRFTMNIEAFFDKDTYDVIKACILMWALKTYKVPDGVRKHRMTKSGGVYPDSFMVLSMGLGLGNIIASLITGAAYDMVCDWVQIMLGEDVLPYISPHTHSDDSDVASACRRDFRHIIAAYITAMMRFINAKHQPVKCRVNQDPHEGLSEYISLRTGDAQTPPVKLLIPANKVKPAGWVQDNIQVKSMLREAMRRGYGLVSIRAAWTIIESDLMRKYNWAKMGLSTKSITGKTFPVEAFGRVEMDPMALLTYGSPPVEIDMPEAVFTVLDPAQGYIRDPGDENEMMLSHSSILAPRVVMPSSKKAEYTSKKYKDMITLEEWERTAKVKELFPLLRVAKVNPEYARDVRLGLYRRRGANSRLNTNSVQGFKIVARAASIPSYRIVGSKNLVVLFILAGAINGWKAKFQEDLQGEPVEIEDITKPSDDFDYSITFSPKWLQDVLNMLETNDIFTPNPLPDVSQNTYHNYLENMESSEEPKLVKQAKYDKIVNLMSLPVQNQFPKIENSILSLLIVQYFPKMNQYVRAPIIRYEAVETDKKSIAKILGPAVSVLEVSQATETEMQQAARLSQAMTMLMQASKRHIQFFTRATGDNLMGVIKSLYRNQYSSHTMMVFGSDLEDKPMVLPDNSMLIPESRRFARDSATAIVMGLARVLYHHVYAKRTWSVMNDPESGNYWGRTAISNITEFARFAQSLRFRDGQEISSFLSSVASSAGYNHAARRYAVTISKFVTASSQVSSDLQMVMDGSKDWTISWLREQALSEDAIYDLSSPFTFTIYRMGTLMEIRYMGGEGMMLVTSNTIESESILSAVDRAYAHTEYRTSRTAANSKLRPPSRNESALYSHVLAVGDRSAGVYKKGAQPKDWSVVALVGKGAVETSKTSEELRLRSYYIKDNLDVSSYANKSVKIPLPFPGDFDEYREPSLTWDRDILESVITPEGQDFNSPWQTIGTFAFSKVTETRTDVHAKFVVSIEKSKGSIPVYKGRNRKSAWEWSKSGVESELIRFNRKLKSGVWTQPAVEGPGGLRQVRTYPVSITEWQGLLNTYFKAYIALKSYGEGVGSLDKLLKFFLIAAIKVPGASHAEVEEVSSNTYFVTFQYRKRDTYAEINQNIWQELISNPDYFKN